jgi:putative transposase
MSYVSAYFHCVFGTKEQQKLITPALEERLWLFLGGIARQNSITPVIISGIEDHVHLLLSLPSSMPISKAMQLVKGRCSTGMAFITTSGICGSSQSSLRD